MAKDDKPLSLGATLRDLALLRASDIDLAPLLPTATQPTSTTDAIDLTVEQSFEFVRQARAAIKIQYNGDVEKAETSVEAVRAKVEELSRGL
ncbi:hypothetical protein FB45DRAFT_200775 [Roridomyces roridus]|uniref:Uncharacterized protein n=1 Tax=Roridomyces roridus TaxID=1738132 RepID=A0AAD7CFJ5_9AGAR|nr:hypothetical protein FB45DRAFT_200775 [Roridomyces roridus]